MIDVTVNMVSIDVIAIVTTVVIVAVVESAINTHRPSTRVLAEAAVAVDLCGDQ